MTTTTETPRTVAEADALVAAAEARYAAAYAAHLSEVRNPTPGATFPTAPIYDLTESLRAAEYDRQVAHNLRARLVGAPRPF